VGGRAEPGRGQDHRGPSAQLLNGEWSGHGAQIATSTALWIVLPLTLGLVPTQRREVR
jgi:hypothetical protein